MRPFNLLTTVIRLNAKIAHIDPNMEIYKPIQIGRELLLQPAVIMLMPTQCAPKQDDELVRESHDGVRQCMSFFLPLECSRCLASSCERR